VQIALGWIMILLGGSLYLAQLISSINFSFAQNLGIQERADTSDALLQRSERYTAYWDLIALVWFPIAGTLMIIDHHLWPIMSLVAGVIYLDTAGREAVKNISFRHEGVKMGTLSEQKIVFSSYIIMVVIALVVIGYAVFKLYDFL